ncbi:D-2-hydroxyacid dehydrogenase family protein [Metabacillus rhizolycopersici]|uniref:D-2-hydroxyacid dehydrogenase family protein n=1 Tax=Metabacillus rhizolycopersici TaxID=2875709 RepID=A0ABS7UWG7_9BACI|nr:D-2-hydroxyacid dehydrogenase family protein [Metabacillus rhizolycopersici]MBZ5752274.1 D-2-hydroxyacid dehydrogenase family protein [Metabacillus rhizolycopersici]
MKLRCAILDDYQNVALEMVDWNSISDKVEFNTFNQHFDNEDELVSVINKYDIIVIMRERTSFRESLLSRLPRLKLLVTTGMRNSSIDLDAATSQGVIVCGTVSHIEPTSELTWALILGLSRNIVHEYNAIRENGPWQSSVGIDLYGKKLGLLGLGKIGSRVARIGQAFGMEVVAWSQNMTKERADEIGVRLAATKEELLSISDFVSIHLVLSERTRGLVGEAELKQMKATAYLINTSRAAIVDQEALIETIQNRWIAGAGIDVFENEPLPQDDVFRSLPNILTTPHLGYVSQRNYQTFYQQAVEDIQAFLSGMPIRKLN